MKKVLVAGLALAIASGLASTASAAAVEPGVKITGDSRVRIAYRDEDYVNAFGNNKFLGATPATSGPAADSQTGFLDTRIRLNVAGTAAGGAYAKARLRLYENNQGDLDLDATDRTGLDGSNIWVDQAYMGIPFSDMVTVEIGKYRSTYGPLGTTYNFFYDDVHLSGARGIVKVGGFEINPFVEWMSEAQGGATEGIVSVEDQREDRDEIRFGAHAKTNINKDWLVGGMIGYQVDSRVETQPWNWNNSDSTRQNTGYFAGIYTKGKVGAFGLLAELGITEKDLNGFNSWLEDDNANLIGGSDAIGSKDTGYGGFINPTYTIDKLTIGLNGGFTQNGFQPDRAYGFVMIGGTDNSAITAQRIGEYGDWLWLGLVANYAFSENLKLTGNLVYADIDTWTNPGDGPGFYGNPNADAAYPYLSTTSGNLRNKLALDSAWEISGVVQYTISKGMNVFLSAGYLIPELQLINYNAATWSGVPIEENGVFGTMARFELVF